MPRKPRQWSDSGYYHFINRGVNKKKIFHDHDDFDFYRSLLREYKERFEISILHYCLMSNHTHLILRCEDLKSLGRFAHFLQRRYAYYYCKNHQWSEQVFRSRYLSIPIENEAYLLECGRYIERNPIEANIVKDLKNYKHSSFNFYGYGIPDPLVTESPLYADLARNSKERMLIYRFNVSCNRDEQVKQNKTVRRFIGQDSNVQPVPF